MSQLLFMTSAVKPADSIHVKFKDFDQRLIETKASIKNVLNYNYFNRLVLVDASNTEILTKNEIEKFEEKGLEIEQLRFQQLDEEITKFGKSFGEVQITNYMLDNSKFIRETDSFIKLSARYTLKNHATILPQISNINNYFVNYHPILIRDLFPFTSTIFFKSTINFYKKNLGGCASECSNERDGWLESVYYRKLKNIRKKQLFIDFPLFEGIASGTGKGLINNHLYKRKLLSYLGFLSFSYD